MPRAFRLAAELWDPRGRQLWAEQLQHSSKVPSTLLVAVRVLLALGMDAVLAYDYWLFCGQSYGLYLTHWALIMECIYLTLGAATSVALHEGCAVPQGTLALNSVLATLVFPCTLLVFALFWVLDFPQWTITLAEYVAIWPTGVLKHGANFFVMCVDFALVEQPLFMADALYPVLFAVTYVSFNAWYFLAGGRTVTGGAYTYAVLDWTQNLGAATKVAAAVLLVVVPVASLLPLFVTRGRGRTLSRRLSELSFESDEGDAWEDLPEDSAALPSGEPNEVAPTLAAKEMAFVKEKLEPHVCSRSRPSPVSRTRRFLTCLSPAPRDASAQPAPRRVCCLPGTTE